MGFNIYEDTVENTAQASIVRQRRTSTEDKSIVTEIFLAHATAAAGQQDGIIASKTAFTNACVALAKAFPSSSCGHLEKTSTHSRAREFFEEDGDGIISMENFTKGVKEILHPTTAETSIFLARLGASKPDLRAQRKMSTFEHVKRVAILGGGVAGLQTANLLQQAGMRCVIFEKTADVGGVWRENYADFGLQVPRELYEFPGFPWPSDTKADLFPKGSDVQDYIQRYAKAFGLYEMCKFHTAVLKATPGRGGRGWTLKYQTKGQDQVTEDFDFFVVASGMYGWPPHIPVARGADQFKGEILHSCTFTDRAQAKDKKVIVVGGGKSAIDCAVAARNGGAKSSMLLCREPHWPVPRYLLHLVPFKWGTYSRFGHAMLPTHHEETACCWYAHSCCTPLKWLWWRIVEGMFCCQFRLPADQRPNMPIEQDLFTGGQILSYEYRDMCKSSLVVTKVSAIDHYTEKGVVLRDGTEVEVDMAIYGTGFAKSYDIFDDAVQPKLGVEKDGLWLYRNIIPPKLKDLAFIGSEVSTFNNVLTHGLQALWLQQFLTGAMPKPSAVAMEKSIEKEQAWKRSWMPPSSARASIWQLHMMKYHDGLLDDMGENHRRKTCCCCEVFVPYQASDYHGMFKQQDQQSVEMAAPSESPKQQLMSDA